MSNYEITEITESRPFEANTPGQMSRLVRNFVAKCVDSVTPSIDNIQEVINDLWAQHSVAVRERLAVDSDFICRKLVIEPIQDSLNFDVRAEYETFANAVDVNNDGGFTPRPPFVRRQSQTSDRMFDLYREGATIPTDGDPLSTADIAGTKVDQQGRPIAVPINTIELQIDIHFDTSDCFINEAVYIDYLNKRNSAACFGFAIGQLLFKSVVISEIGAEWYQITFRMIADQYYHLRQIPKLDINGNVQLTGTSGIGQAADVYWFQPYKSKFDFEDLFTSEEWDYLTRTCP